MKKVCIRGNSKHPEKVIQFLEKLGIKNKWNWKFLYRNMFYFADKDGDLDSSVLKPDDYTEISFADACAILDGKAVLNDDCTVTYKSEFPCEMWVWYDDIKDCVYREVHGYIPTLAYCWIAKDYTTSAAVGWKNASLTDPRIEETITIEEAEELLGKKIRR